jgi:hypothetical protein
MTKKRLALSLHDAGSTVEAIAQALDTSPSAIAHVVAAAGRTPDDQDLYVSTAALSGYTKQFQGHCQVNGGVTKSLPRRGCFGALFGSALPFEGTECPKMASASHPATQIFALR